MENKNYKGLVWLVVILIILVVALMGFIVYREFYSEEKTSVDSTTNTTANNLTDEGKTLKFDNTKKWIYDANYPINLEEKAHTIDGVLYNIEDYKVPFVNINSNYGKKINEEIKKYYEQAIKIFNDGVKDGISHVDKFKYNYYLNGNILSLILDFAYTTNGEDLISHIITYNINIINGEEIKYQEILDYVNISHNDLYKKAKNEINDVFEKKYAIYIDNQTILKTHKENTMQLFEDQGFMDIYIDYNGKINFKADISFPEGVGKISEIITVK